MNDAPHSDALVFFGATGDLVYKKISPISMRWNGGGTSRYPLSGSRDRSGPSGSFGRAPARVLSGVVASRRSSQSSRSGFTTSAATTALRPPTPRSGRNLAVRHTRYIILQSLPVCSGASSRGSASLAALVAPALLLRSLSAGTSHLRRR
jgi:hypothetical protein